jgi:hypothetical protein
MPVAQLRREVFFFLGGKEERSMYESLRSLVMPKRAKEPRIACGGSFSDYWVEKLRGIFLEEEEDWQRTLS